MFPAEPEEYIPAAGLANDENAPPRPLNPAVLAGRWNESNADGPVGVLFAVEEFDALASGVAPPSPAWAAHGNAFAFTFEGVNVEESGEMGVARRGVSGGDDTALADAL